MIGPVAVPVCGALQLLAYWRPRFGNEGLEGAWLAEVLVGVVDVCSAGLFRVEGFSCASLMATSLCLSAERCSGMIFCDEGRDLFTDLIRNSPLACIASGSRLVRAPCLCQRVMTGAFVTADTAFHNENVTEIYEYESFPPFGTMQNAT